MTCRQKFVNYPPLYHKKADRPVASVYVSIDEVIFLLLPLLFMIRGNQNETIDDFKVFKLVQTMKICFILLNMCIVKVTFAFVFIQCCIQMSDDNFSFHYQEHVLRWYFVSSRDVKCYCLVGNEKAKSKRKTKER